jgi:hypothetical protein
MNKTTQNEQLTKIGNLVSSQLLKYEVIIVLVFLTGLVLRLTTDLKVSALIILSLNTLATLYFFSAFSVPKDENANGLEIFINKLASFSSSVAIIGILFRLQHWPGYNNMIILGCITLIILIPVILIIKSKKPDLTIFNQRLIIRLALVAVLGLFINFAPKDTLIKAGLDKKIPVEKIE